VRAPLVIAIGLSFGPTLAGAQTSGQADHTLSTTSIQRIRVELERTPRLTLDVAGETPHFQMIIREPQRFRDEAGFRFSTEPVPPGGLYAFEARHQVGPPMATPLIVVDVMPIARAVAGAIQNARTASRRTAAREEVKHAIEEYCEAQPDRGAGIQMCSISLEIR
jgi:hypothetical protein